MHKRSQKGFTLVELAIVLGVSSLLLTGLWRLMSSGNTRTRDQVAAEQHRQIVTAAQAYLETTEGQTKLAALAPTSSDVLKIPSGTWTDTVNCRLMANMSDTKGFCDYLPVLQSDLCFAYSQG
jgi:prepilin-type N-terminal cleavage/methylation domain-containing protein